MASKTTFVAAATASMIFLYFAIARIGFLFKDEKFDNQGLRKLEVFPIVGAVGPESFAFDQFGNGPYTGVSDGRIIKWHAEEQRWIDFATTAPQRCGCEGPQEHERTEHVCGRPLGLEFNQKTGQLYIADAYMGLLVVGSRGGLAHKIATSAQGFPFRFTNALDIDQNSGFVYFTDSSLHYQRRNFISLIISRDTTGRLMKYDPQTKQVTVLLNNLSFPNGVFLSEDGNFIIIAETSSCRILKYWLKTSKAGTAEVLAANLPGFPDNIRRSPRGGIWVGVHSKRSKFFDLVLSCDWIRMSLLKVPLIDIGKVYSVLAKFVGKSGMGLRLSEENGEVLEMLKIENGKTVTSVSEIVERKDGSLWIGSVNMGFAGKVRVEHYT